MHVAHLTLHNFRSYADIDVALEPGATAFIGRNGQGKTNLVEAIDYLSRLSSHRVATDAPLVRAGADQAIVRASVVKEGRTALIEVELNPGRANRARINRSPLPRPREIVGVVRTVVFAPDDLTLVKGDPSDRRKFLDDLLMLRSPRLAGVRSDYSRILKQRNSLLKTAGPTSARPTRQSPAARAATTPTSTTRRASTWVTTSSSRCSRPSPRGARRSSTGASRWSARTATSCCSPSAPGRIPATCGCR